MGTSTANPVCVPASTPQREPRRRDAGRKRRVRRFVPPQHGAWAMLLVPWLAGTLIAGFRWLHLPLLLAWLTGYLASYYALLAVKTRRLDRVRTQLLVYGLPTVLLGALVLALRPALLWYAPAYALLLAVNARYAFRRNDRALLNDLASVVQSCLMVFVCASVAGAAPSHAQVREGAIVALGEVTVAFAALTAYFVGTVLHVKSLIRERGDVRYRWASLAFHLLAFAAAVWVGVALAVVFALLAVRAWLLSGRVLGRTPAWHQRLTPARIGVVEIVASVALLGALIVT